MGFLVLPRLQRLLELLPVQSDFLRQLGEDFRITDILLFLEKRSQNTAIVFVPTPFLLRVLKSFKGQMSIRLGGHAGKYDPNSHSFRHRVYGTGPGRLQIILFRSQGRMRAGTEFKGHPLHLDILPFDSFFERKLRQETVGSHIIGIDSNQHTHPMVSSHSSPFLWAIPKATDTRSSIRLR